MTDWGNGQMMPEWPNPDWVWSAEVHMRDLRPFYPDEIPLLKDSLTNTRYGDVTVVDINPIVRVIVGYKGVMFNYSISVTDDVNALHYMAGRVTGPGLGMFSPEFDYLIAASLADQDD